MAKIVLGAGLNGLLATKAVEDAGGKVDKIITDKLTGLFPGFMVLEDDCGLSLEQHEISIEMVGDESIYSFKRGERKGGSSWFAYKDCRPKHKVYNPYEAYTKLLAEYGDKIEYAKLNYIDIDYLSRQGHTIISTIPMPVVFPGVLYSSNKGFLYKMGAGISCEPEGMYVEYNGDENTPHSRKSHLWGETWYEYTNKEQISIISGDTIIPFTKPVSYHGKFVIPPNLFLEGRLGEWVRKRKAEDVYWRIYGKTRKGIIPTL